MGCMVSVYEYDVVWEGCPVCAVCVSCSLLQDTNFPQEALWEISAGKIATL